MLYLISFDALYSHIVRAYNDSATKNHRICLLLIGGCSRSGKTTLSLRISERFSRENISSVVVSLDAWIVSVEKRKPNTTLVERYECDAIVRSISALLEGRAVFPPVYDAFSRRRISERSEQPLFIESGIIITDGVLALALAELRRRSLVKIFVDIPDSERVQRVKDFYINQKNVLPDQAEKIVKEREREEVLFIKGTRQYADIIFAHEFLSNSKEVA